MDFEEQIVLRHNLSTLALNAWKKLRKTGKKFRKD